MTTLNKAGSQYVLNGLGRAVTAAGSGVGVAAVSKVINGHSGFSWANIAASAASASIGGRLPGEGLNTNGFGNDLLMRVASSAVGYGVNRAFGGDRSWNGRDVVADAFGNALGNSIVSKLSQPPQMSEAEKKGRAMLSAVGQSISDDTMVGVERSIGDAQRNMAVDLNQTTENFNNFSSAYSAYSSDYQLGVAGQISGFYTAKSIASNADYANRKVDLSLRTANQYQSILASAQNSFDAGLNRGMASYNYHAADRIASTKAFTAQSRLNNQMNQQRYNELQSFGTFGDFVYGAGEGLVDSIYQGVQFLGTAAASLSPVGQAISHLSGNGSLNPFTTDYHSMLDAPTTVQQAGGRQFGEIASIVVPVEGAVLAVSKLSKVSQGVSEALRYEQHWDDLATVPQSLNNRNTRAWYLSKEMEIPSMLDRSSSVEVQARQAFDIRNSLRSGARDLMSDQKTANYLRMNEPNLTFEELVSIKSVNNSGDDIWKSIIESSQKSRTKVNAQFQFIGDR